MPDQQAQRDEADKRVAAPGLFDEEECGAPLPALMGEFSVAWSWFVWALVWR